MKISFPSLDSCWCVQVIGPVAFFLTAFPAVTVLSTWPYLVFSFPLLFFNELKTSVSSRVACPDYHCLLAQWMEVSICVTTAGFTEQTHKPLKQAASWLSLHQRSFQLLDTHCLVGVLTQRHCTGFVISNCMVHQMTVNPARWVLTKTKSKLWRHLCVFHTCVIRRNHVVFELFWNDCAICSDAVKTGFFYYDMKTFKHTSFFKYI